MNKERKINFKKYTSLPKSKIYLLKILFYIIITLIIFYVLIKKDTKKNKIKEEKIKEIYNIKTY
ncbi:MAG: hypothetical protein CL844_09530 [Crocinitomicaceae bacterium]|nr:hypothetical protein [Crocinitomicaceae bacterium]